MATMIIMRMMEVNAMVKCGAVFYVFVVCMCSLVERDIGGDGELDFETTPIVW